MLTFIKFVFFTLRPLSKTADIWDIKDIIIAVIALLGWGGGGGWTMTINADIGIGILAGIPALLLLVAGMKLQKKINTYEDSQIELNYDSSCNIFPEADSGEMCNSYHYCMVLVQATGKYQIDGVVVVLKSITPDPYPLGAIPLLPRDKSDQERGSSTVRPKQPCYWEVASWDNLSRGAKLHYLEHYTRHGVSKPLPDDKYSLVLSVTGSSRGVSVNNERRFVLEVDSRRGFEFYPEVSS